MMFINDALSVLSELKVGAGKTGDDTVIKAIETIEQVLSERGCANCKHEDIEPWDSPCYDCSHNHKDYYTPK